MKHVKEILENALYVAETNEPINRRDGRIAQADLELEVASEIRSALQKLFA